MRVYFVVFIALGACSSPGPGPAISIPPTPSSSEDERAALVVKMTGFRSDDGKALVGLFDSKDGFPSDGSQAVKRLEVSISDGVATAEFEVAAARTVAVGVLHDEDGDKQMKTGLFGQPKEGYGVTLDAPARFGPPKFSDSSLAIPAGKTLTTTVRIRY